jgi:hypothetical protein
LDVHRLALLVVVGCSAPAKPVAAAATPSGPPYLALFDDGHAWSLPIAVASGHMQPEFKHDAASTGTLTCTTSDVHRVGDATVAKLGCAKPFDDLLIIGTWVASPAGLFHPALPIDGPDDLVMLGENDLLINVAPRERQHSHALEGSPDAPVAAPQEEIESWKHDKGWCVKDSTTADPDRRSFTICFDGTGIAGGADLVITGPEKSWHRSIFGAAPHDLNDPTRPPVEDDSDGDEN